MSQFEGEKKSGCPEIPSKQYSLVKQGTMPTKFFQKEFRTQMFQSGLLVAKKESTNFFCKGPDKKF